VNLHMRKFIISVLILLLSFSISAFASATGVVNTDVLNFRSGPGTGYGIIGQLVQGGNVQIVEHVNSEWVKVSYNGNVGYVCTKYLNIRESNPTDRSGVERNGIAVNANGYVSATSLNFRTYPAIGENLICTLPQYTQLFVIESYSDGWSKVSYNDTIGYVSLSYIVMGEAPQAPAAVSLGQQVVDFAKQYLGKPYVYGANGPNSFDCSGFTKFVFKNFGINIERTAASQLNNGYYVPKDQLQLGDIVFFKQGGVVNHVGIYIGDGVMIHASSAGSNVKYTSIMSGYHCDHYYSARRVI